MVAGARAALFSYAGGDACGGGVTARASRCYGCANVFIGHCLELLEALVAAPSWRAELARIGLPEELLRCNLHLGPKPQRMRARQVLVRLARGAGRAPLASLQALLRAKVRRPSSQASWTRCLLRPTNKSPRRGEFENNRPGMWRIFDFCIQWYRVLCVTLCHVTPYRATSLHVPWLRSNVYQLLLRTSACYRWSFAFRRSLLLHGQTVVTALLFGLGLFSSRGMA